MHNILSKTKIFLIKYKLPFLSGFLLGTSYIPFPPWALFICLIPLWFFWINSDLKKIFVGTLVCAFVSSLIGFHWIAFTAHEFGQLPWILSILALSGFSLIANASLVFAGLIWGILDLQINKRISLWLIPIITSITVNYFPALFPWNYGYAWIYAQFPGAQLADIFGVVGLATITIFINFFVFIGIKENKRLPYLLTAFVIFASANALGLLRINYVPKNTKSLNVLITQANIGNIEKQYAISKYNYRENIINKYIGLTLDAINSNEEKIDLLVWPETAYPAYIDLNKFSSSARALHQLTKGNQVSLITGYYAFPSDNQVANGALYINNQGELADTPTYKSILLAFGEYLPGESLFPSLRKLLPMIGDFKAGNGPQPKQINDISYGTLICYESLFPWFSRRLANLGTNILVNLTNDSWYDDTFEPNQHLYITAGRAIENRRPLIRSTNTGISTVINMHGYIAKPSKRNIEWAESYKVHYPDKNYQTLYQKWGRNFHPIFLLLMLIFGITLGRIKL